MKAANQTEWWTSSGALQKELKKKAGPREGPGRSWRRRDDQNFIWNASCTMRASRVSVTLPKDGFVWTPD